MADGGPAVGLGHLARCSAIAAGLRARGATVRCLAYGADAPTRVDAIDWEPSPSRRRHAAARQLRDARRRRAAIAERSRLVVLHDEGEPPPGTALTIAVTGEPGPDRLTGLAYAPLRPPYWGLPPRTPRDTVERILVTTGGGALQDAGIEIATRIRAAHDAAVALVRGPVRDVRGAGRRRADRRADVAAGAHARGRRRGHRGRPDALEAVATGAATSPSPMVGNQRRNARGAARGSAAQVVEPARSSARCTSSTAHALAERGQRAVDGYGALRIAYRIAALAAQPRRT